MILKVSKQTEFVKMFVYLQKQKNMDAILNFLNEMRRSDWFNNVPFQERKYNDITIQESEQSYYNKVYALYSAAVITLVNVPIEKYEMLQGLIDEVVDCQKSFEMPTDELLNSLMHDFNQSNHQIRGLKNDYDYLCFVRECMKIQLFFLDSFKKKLPIRKTDVIDNKEAESISIDSTATKEPIKGVKGLASYLRVGTTKAQEIINSNILQEKGVAYRVGNGWNFHPQKLEELLSKNPELLYKRNK